MSNKKNKLPDQFFYAYVIAVFVLIYSVSALNWNALALAISVSAILICVYYVIGKLQRNIFRWQDNQFAQYECRQQLLQFIQPQRPFPATRGYRGSPDFLLEVYARIKALKPEVIVEGSSGLSSIVCGYALQQLGRGQVISMEHDAHYADLSQQAVVDHGLENIVNVRHAPLIKHTIKETAWQWYDFKSVGLPNTIDFIVIDGPPKRLQDKARYPALPILIKSLKVGGVLMLDDADRSSESEAVKDWQAEFKNISVEYIPLEKGLFVVTKTSEDVE